MKVAVLGSGAWGSALAVVSAKSGNDVLLWSYDGLVSDFDGVKDITITRYADVATAYSVWLIATPAEFFRETIRKFAPFYNNQTVIICTKGIEPKTHKFMSEILAEELPNCKNFGILSGPQFPAEAADGIPTSSTIRGNEIVIKAGTDALNKMELVPTDDIIGAQICGVGKNAVALLMGYMSVMAAGENERARILTKRWGEVAQFGINMGARCDTFLALCGLGDLFLSATSTTSRNYSGGVAIAKGKKIIGTVEGISALNGLIARSKRDMPIMSDMQKLVISQ